MELILRFVSSSFMPGFLGFSGSNSFVPISSRCHSCFGR